MGFLHIGHSISSVIFFFRSLKNVFSDNKAVHFFCQIYQKTMGQEKVFHKLNINNMNMSIY
nr:MAG TPA: arginyl-tRNA synthetase [Caudoviricetes sp.]